MDEHWLKYGITGFHETGSPAPPIVPTKQILAGCHAVAQNLVWTVDQVEWAASAQSFHTIRLRSHDQAISVLFNRHYPVLAFAMNALVGNMKLQDSAVHADAFRRLTAFQPIPKAALERPAADFEIDHLNSAEIAQMRYWKPNRLSDMIFYFWD